MKSFVRRYKAETFYLARNKVSPVLVYIAHYTLNRVEIIAEILSRQQHVDTYSYYNIVRL